MKTYIVLMNLEANPHHNKEDLLYWQGNEFPDMSWLRSTFEDMNVAFMELDEFTNAFNNDTFYQGELYITYVYVKG